MGRINLDISDEVHHWLKIYAVKEEITLPEAVDRLLRQVLQPEIAHG